MEQLAQTLKEAPEMSEELRRLSLSDTRSLQRRGLQEGERRAGMMLVLLQRDVLLQANVVTAEAMNLRVRQSEQLAKLTNALRRGGRGLLDTPRRQIPQRAMPPTTWPDTEDDGADDEQTDDQAADAATEE